MKRFRIVRTALLAFALTAGLSVFAPALSALPFTTWIGTDGDWTNRSNWTVGVPSTITTGQDIAQFNGQGSSAVTGATGASSLEFDSGDYTINFVTVAKKGQASSTITVNAGTQTFNGVDMVSLSGVLPWTVAAGATLNVNNRVTSGFASGTHSFNVNGTAHLFGAVTVAITKSGTGTLTLDAASGATNSNVTVNAGTLLVNGVSSSGGVFAINSGGTLGGRGTIGTTTTINSGATLAPGVSGPGVLTFGSALTLASGSLTNFDINGTTRGTDYDGLNVGGQISYGGTLTLNFASSIQGGNTLDLLQLTGGVAPSTSFSSILATGYYNGSFSDSGGIWSLSASGQTFTFDQSTGDLTVTATAVPEPATCAALAGAAALGFVAYRRRRGGAANV